MRIIVTDYNPQWPGMFEGEVRTRRGKVLAN